MGSGGIIRALKKNFCMRNTGCVPPKCKAQIVNSSILKMKFIFNYNHCLSHYSNGVRYIFFGDTLYFKVDTDLMVK